MNIETCKRCEKFCRGFTVEMRFLLGGKTKCKFLVFPQFCQHPSKHEGKSGLMELPLSILEQMNKRPYKKVRPLMDFTYDIKKNCFKEIPYKIKGMKEQFDIWFYKEFMFKQCPYYVEHLMESYHESGNLQKM